MDPKDYSMTTKLFPDAKKVAYKNYEKTYNAVSKGDCACAVMPFEASLTGEVGHVLDLMFRGDLFVNEVSKIKNGDESVRYAVLSREEKQEGSDDGWFLLMFTVKDETGSLAKAINAISDNGFNMRIMRSRPMGDLPWHYYFYAEAAGDDTSENGKKMLAQLNEVCESVKVIGRYREV
jgi:prephenate dehydratase